MNKIHKKTVYIVDDDESVRDSILELVESVGLDAEAYESAQAFVESYTPRESACLVLDVRMAGMSGLALQERLSASGLDIPIIFVTGHGDIRMAVTALQAGAVDFIEKPYREQQLLDSIDQALAKSENGLDSDLHERLADLTQRETEVYDKLIEGRSSKVIARDLDISPRTVEVHRQNLLRKLGFASANQLMASRAHSRDTPLLRAV